LNNKNTSKAIDKKGQKHGVYDSTREERKRYYGPRKNNIILL